MFYNTPLFDEVIFKYNHQYVSNSQEFSTLWWGSPFTCYILKLIITTVFTIVMNNPLFLYFHLLVSKYSGTS